MTKSDLKDVLENLFCLVAAAIMLGCWATLSLDDAVWGLAIGAATFPFFIVLVRFLSADSSKADPGTGAEGVPQVEKPSV